MEVMVTWKEVSDGQGHCHTGMQLLSLAGIMEAWHLAYKAL